MTRVWTGLFVLWSVAVDASALTAVAEVREDEFYTQRKESLYPGASLTKYYAPLPVFFEGWKSSPRTEIVDYSWDFGDGSPAYRGFNAAHVYEKPGTYYARLTVTDGGGTRASSSTLRIDVLPPSGITYYVDSQAGKDSNDGKSMGSAWKTATKAFSGLLDKRYKAGDRILFKRGQTFDVEAGLVVGHYTSGYGYLFGAYGSGAKPIIQKVGGNTAPIIKLYGLGFGHVCFQDLEFRLTSPQGVASGELLAVTVEAFNLLFLRVDLKHMSRGWGFNGGHDKYRISGVFLQDCSMFNSTNVQLYARCARLALLNNNFDLSENHINYLSYVDKAVIAGNIFTRPPFGRTALRISASSDYGHPSNNVCITDNWIQGWIDPQKSGETHGGQGTRYTWELIDIGPNKEGEQSIEEVAFERNVVVDGETLLVLGDAENVSIKDNIFYTDDRYPAAYRIQLGSRFESRPLKNIRIRNNAFVSNESRQYYAGMFGILKYADTAYKGRTCHEDIAILGNRIEMRNCNGAAAVFIEDSRSTQLAEVDEDSNLIYAPELGPGEHNVFMIGGDYVKGNLIDLPAWRRQTGNGFRTYVVGEAEAAKLGAR